MIIEGTYLIRIISDHLAKQATSPQAGVNWRLMLNLANAHNVTGIVYQQCKTFIPNTYLESFKQSFIWDLVLYANRTKIVNEIQSNFVQQGIQSIVIKGTVIAQQYPIPALRTMGDIDILVHQEDKERADEILCKLGFQTKTKNPHYDWTYKREWIELELHHQLLYIYDNDINDPAQMSFFNQFWQYVQGDQLDWSFHLLFLLIHLKKHLMLYGAGFRMFMDIAVIIQSNVLVNWKWIERKLEEFDLLQFARVCFRLIDDWFMINPPIDCPLLSEEQVNTLSQKVLDNGVFGMNNPGNESNVDINAIMYGNQRWLYRIKTFFRNVFPNFKRIAYVSEYRFIEKKPWLLPAAWVYRFYRLLNKKTESASSIMRRIMVSNDLIDERQRELQGWGLKHKKR